MIGNMNGGINNLIRFKLETSEYETMDKEWEINNLFQKGVETWSPIILLTPNNIQPHKISFYGR